MIKKNQFGDFQLPQLQVKSVCVGKYLQCTCTKINDLFSLFMYVLSKAALERTLSIMHGHHYSLDSVPLTCRFFVIPELKLVSE